MSEGSDHSYNAPRSEASSSEVNEPGLGRRSITSRIIPTQASTNTDHNYVIEPQSAVPVQDDVDEIPREYMAEDDDVDDDEDEDLDGELDDILNSIVMAYMADDEEEDDEEEDIPPFLLYRRSLRELLAADSNSESEADEVESEIDELSLDGAQGGIPTDGSRISDNEDDGLSCSLCLHNWEMFGPHRLVSLRCGHLFGDSCVRNWMTECCVCPNCKAKALPQDIRYLYAKRVRTIDRREENSLREFLKTNEERVSGLQTDFDKIKMLHTLIETKNNELQMENDRLRETLRSVVSNGASVASESRWTGVAADPKKLPYYTLCMEHNFEITNERGSRVMVYSSQQSTLIASQKSVRYGVCFIDVPTFKPVKFLQTSDQIIRDICLSARQQEMAVASMEKCCKLYDLRTHQVTGHFRCNDKFIWSCAMDRNGRENGLYLGDHYGSVNSYDMRYPNAFVGEFPNPGRDPVTRIVPVQANKAFPSGGLLVCMLRSLWFYEFTNNTVVPTRLSVSGQFLSLDYDTTHESLLITTCSDPHNSQMRFILGKLVKINEFVIFATKITFFGSKESVIMTRAKQIATASHTLVVGYEQGTRQLVVYDVEREECVQSMPVNDIVFDVCPIHLPGNMYLAALTAGRCHIYNISSSPPI